MEIEHVVLLGAALAWASSHAHAQVENMPAQVQQRLAEVGPGWGKDIAGNIAKTLEVYTPLLAVAPKMGIATQRGIPYGNEARQRLDTYAAEGLRGAPVVVFFHGGAYVRGDRDVNAEVYANVLRYFARNGMLGINATYRLAPAAKWPAAAEDVGAVVRWLKANAARQGGDPEKIWLIGHSAGATHIATYAYMKELQPAEGPGFAGIVLMSGRYKFEPNPDDPNLKNFQAYFGTDASQYPARSPISHVKDAPKFPTFLIVSEYDNPDLDTQGALLLAALCERDRACPRFKRMEKHNHLSMVYQFNTADDATGREILEFMRRGR